MSEKSSNSVLDRQALGAFFLYLGLSVLFFGRGLIGHFSTWYIGRGPDSAAFIWFLDWWAYAATHRVNPFLTKLLFAPVGVNLAWATTIPLAGWFAVPITSAFGPIVTYNILCLLAPALAGWAAFVLCRWITSSHWSSIAGGWVFGFSTYLVAALQTHVHDTLVFPLPLVVWLILRRRVGEIEARRFVSAVAILIAVQFLLFAEVAASATLVGAIAIALALSFVDSGTRRSILALLPEIGAAYAIAAILISPYLYYMFSFGHPSESVFDPTMLGADLLSFLIPTSINEWGRPALFGVVSRTYMATLTEVGSYLAWPLIAISVLFAKARFREPVGRTLIELLVIVCLLALGARVVIAGHPTIAAPWMVLLRFPLMNKVVPVRLMVYAFLALAVIVAMWLSSDAARPSLRWGLGLALLPFMLPNLSASFWRVPFVIPPFFSTGLYRQYLRPGENVMVLPNPIYGDGIQWQIATGMYFRLAGGYIGISPLAPPEYARWPIMAGLYDVAGVPDAGEQLKVLLAHEQVAAIIVSPLKYRFVEQFGGHWTSATWLHTALTEPERASLRDLLSTLGVQPLQVGGVTLYRIPPERLAPYLHVTALEMQERCARARFEVLLGAAEKYFAGGGDLESLDSHKAQALGAAPQWFGGPAFPTLNPNKIFQVQWALGQWHPGRVAIGVEGSYEALRPLIAQYGPDSTDIHFPFPQRLAAHPSTMFYGDSAPALMVMEFTRAGLASAYARVTPRSFPPKLGAWPPESSVCVDYKKVSILTSPRSQSWNWSERCKLRKIALSTAVRDRRVRAGYRATRPACCRNRG
jgi:hypothetical protein